MWNKFITILVAVAFMLSIAGTAGARGAWEPRRVDTSRSTIVDHEEAPEFRTAKRLRTTGMVLTIVGIPFVVLAVISGVALATSTSLSTRQLTGGGTLAASIIGAGLMGCGIPFWVIGQNKMDYAVDHPLALAF